MVKDVQVITGGASAVYGADAVTGVVNFILKDDFEGLQILNGLTGRSRRHYAIITIYNFFRLAPSRLTTVDIFKR